MSFVSSGGERVGLAPLHSGIKNTNAKLNNHSVKKIRKLYLTDKYSQKEISNIFNVSQGTIHSILKLKTWKI